MKTWMYLSFLTNQNRSSVFLSRKKEFQLFFNYATYSLFQVLGRILGGGIWHLAFPSSIQSRDILLVFNTQRLRKSIWNRSRLHYNSKSVLHSWKKRAGLAGVIRNKTWFKESDLDVGGDKIKLATPYFTVCQTFTSFIKSF